MLSVSCSFLHKYFSFAQVTDCVEGLVELCAENIVVYHNPSSSLAPMYGRYFGIEGFLMWLKGCTEELTLNSRPRNFNFSSSGNYVFCEVESDVTVKKTGKKLTISRIMKFLFNAEGKFVTWDVMEDSAPLVEVGRSPTMQRMNESMSFFCEGR